MLSRLVLVLLVGLAPTGCVPYWHGKDMRASIAQNEGQIDQLLADHRAQREKNEKRLATLTTRVDALDAALKKDLDNIRNNTAESGESVSELQRELATLRGELETYKHEQAKQNATGAGDVVIQPGTDLPALPSDAAELYTYGWKKYKADDCDEANRAFFRYADQFKKKDKADNALYLAAKCLFRQKDYRGSSLTLKRITEDYKKGDKVDDAQELLHDNFLAQGKCEVALAFIERLVVDYPNYKHMKRARRKLKTAQRTCGGQ